jgi:hypothetical protein
MRAGEHSTNFNPANKTARDQTFTRLVFLLKGMNSPLTASGHGL